MFRERRKVLIIVVIVIISSLAFNYFANYWGMQKVGVEEDRFSIYIPDDWTVEYANPSPEIDVSGAFAYDDTRENFIFIVVSPTETPDFKEDLKKWQKQFEAVNFKYISSEITTFNGRDVATYEATTMNGDIPYYQKGFITYENGNKYVVLAQCKGDTKDEMLVVFEKMFDSFKIQK